MHRRRLTCNQLAQHKLQNAAVGVILRLLRRVDAHQSAEFFLPGTDPYLLARSKLPDQVADRGNLEDFIAREAQRLRAFSREKLQRQNSHTYQVRAVNTLITFRD